MNFHTRRGEISVGAVFIKTGTPVPTYFPFDSEPHDGWERLAPVYNEVEAIVISQGWHFAYILPAIEGRALGLRQQSAINRALQRVLEQVDRSGFNALEITRFKARSILGVYSVDLVAHPRHLQPNPYLREPDPRLYRTGIWDFEPIFWRQAEAEPETKGI